MTAHFGRGDGGRGSCGAVWRIKVSAYSDVYDVDGRRYDYDTQNENRELERRYSHARWAAANEPSPASVERSRWALRMMYVEALRYHRERGSRALAKRSVGDAGVGDGECAKRVFADIDGVLGKHGSSMAEQTVSCMGLWRL